MATPYDRYLRRLRSKIQKNPYYQSARRTAFASSPQQSNFDTLLRKNNVPVGVASQHELSSQAQRQNNLTGVVERAGVRDIERKEAIGARIDEIGLKRDEFKRQQKDKFGDQLLQAGGAVIGGAIGLAVGAPLQGAQMGASAGQILGGFTGDNSEDITAGLGNAIGTFAQISATKSNKLMGESASQLLGQFNTLNADQRQLIMQQLQIGTPIDKILNQFLVEG